MDALALKFAIPSLTTW